jgi:hypothetical protein
MQVATAHSQHSRGNEAIAGGLRSDSHFTELTDNNFHKAMRRKEMVGSLR